MPDYIPLQVSKIKESVDPTTKEIRLSAECFTIQPEQINLNLSRLDAARLTVVKSFEGKTVMIPIRRGEVNGRAFTSIADGQIFPIDVKPVFNVPAAVPPVAMGVPTDKPLVQR